jgi:hypothetical protein
VPLYDSRVNVLNWVLLAGIFRLGIRNGDALAASHRVE